MYGGNEALQKKYSPASHSSHNCTQTNALCMLAACMRISIQNSAQMIARHGDVRFSGAGVLATATCSYHVPVVDHLLLDSHIVALAVYAVVIIM